MKTLIVGMLMGVAIGMLIGGYGPYSPVARNLRQQAIDAKVARWTIDPATGEKTFVFGLEDRP